MSTKKEDDFGKTIQSLVYFGGSIETVLEHPKFQQRLCFFSRRYDFSVFRGERTEDDLQQDVSLKLLQLEFDGKLKIPGNVQTEAQFFGWLFFVVRNHHVDTIRQRLAQKRDGLRSYKSPDDFDFPALEIDQTEEAVLSQFPEFIKQYPPDWQLAIRLWWQKGKSYRRIARILVRLKRPEVSHTTIGNRITAILEAYRLSFEARGSLKRTGT